MTKTITLKEWSDILAEQIKSIRPVVFAATEVIAAEAAMIARGKIGYYQAAVPPFRAWAPLADSTMDEKTNAGYAPPDNPLLRTGEMRESIKHGAASVAPNGSAVAVIGSDDPKAMMHEFGTSRMPPRPFIGAAMIEVEIFAKRELEKALALILG